MLILDRKENESVIIYVGGRSIRILVTEGDCKLGFDAPRDMKIMRGELVEKAMAKLVEEKTP